MGEHDKTVRALLLAGHRGRSRVMFVLGFPLLLIPFAIYNMIAFLTPGVSWTAPVTTVHMMSGQDWVLTWEDILLAFRHFFALGRNHQIDADGHALGDGSHPGDGAVHRHAGGISAGAKAGTSTFFPADDDRWSTCWPASSSASAARSVRSRSKARTERLSMIATKRERFATVAPRCGRNGTSIASLRVGSSQAAPGARCLNGVGRLAAIRSEAFRII
jgi:hypothetical protein